MTEKISEMLKTMKLLQLKEILAGDSQKNALNPKMKETRKRLRQLKINQSRRKQKKLVIS